MANASPRDTRAGWDIFLRAGGNVSLDEINDALNSAGYGRVASRTFSHYHRLMRAGYTRYIPINPFDVAHAAEPYDSPATKGRYNYREVDVGVEVTFAKASALFETFGRATELGDVGAVLNFEDRTVREGLKKLRPAVGNTVSIRFLEAGRTLAGRIIETDLVSVPARVEVEYQHLTSIADIATGEALITSEAQFVLIPQNATEDTIDVAGRRLYLFFELIEGVRAVINSAGALQPNPVYADPPTLTRLSIASPAVIVIQIADAVKHLFPYGLMTSVLLASGRAIKKRKEWYEGTTTKYEAQEQAHKAKEAQHRTKQEEERAKQEALKTAQAERELQLKQKQADAEEAETEVAILHADLQKDLLTQLRKQLPASELSDETVNALIESEVARVIDKLAESGVREIQEREPPS